MCVCVCVCVHTRERGGREGYSNFLKRRKKFDLSLRIMETNKTCRTQLEKQGRGHK